MVVANFSSSLSTFFARHLLSYCYCQDHSNWLLRYTTFSLHQVIRVFHYQKKLHSDKDDTYCLEINFFEDYFISKR